MPADGTELTGEFTHLLLPRVGATVAGLALLFPVLTLPLAVACLVALGNAAKTEAGADRSIPEIPPAARPRRRAVRPQKDVETSSEDSFPASDPPSWTPVTGTGSRH